MQRPSQWSDRVPDSVRPLLTLLTTLPTSLPDADRGSRTRWLYDHLFQKQVKLPGIQLKYPNNNWKIIWKAFRNPYIPTDWKVKSYEVINEIIPTEEKKYRHNMAQSPLCPTCGRMDTPRHRLVHCMEVRQIWDWTTREIAKLFPTHMLVQRYALFLQLQPVSSQHGFLQTWFVMGYHYFVLMEPTKTVNNFKTVLRKEKQQLGKLKSPMAKRCSVQVALLEL